MATTDLEPGRRQCVGTNRQGARCGNAPIPGGTVCRMHGGAIKRVKAAAERRLALQQAEEHVRANLDATKKLDLPGVYQELLKTVAMSVQWRDRFQEKVDALTSMRYESMIGTEQIRAEVTIFERAMAATLKGAEMIARLDLDSRIKALSTHQGDLVALAVNRALDAGDLTPAQRDAIERQLAVELRRAAGGGM